MDNAVDECDGQNCFKNLHPEEALKEAIENPPEGTRERAEATRDRLGLKPEPETDGVS
jgi:hypothetical protein